MAEQSTAHNNTYTQCPSDTAHSRTVNEKPILTASYGNSFWL
jgi:hypothetical protein